MTSQYLDERNDPFWSEDPKILIDRKRLIEFVPTSDMTWKERLNSLTRLAVYSSLLLAMYQGKSWPLYIALAGVVIALFLFHFGPKDNTQKEIKAPDEHPTSDSPNPFIPKNQPKCIPPTRNNPFMNVMQNEYVDNPTRPPACDYDDVKDQVEKQWSYNLYQDIDDALWNRNNSQREWFTMPWTTIPNDQGAFANWCYKTGPTCKTDQTACLRYEDLRANRSVVGDSEYLM